MVKEKLKEPTETKELNEEYIDYLKDRLRDNLEVILFHKKNREQLLDSLQELADVLANGGTAVPQKLKDQQKQYEEELVQLQRAYDACSMLIENPLDMQTFRELFDAEEKAGIKEPKH